MKALKVVCLGLVCLSGCSGTNELQINRPEVDMSPVGCGYKWFQSGYSPTLERPCDQDRSDLQESQRVLALDHAWEVAETRCPTACPPIELQDSIEVEDQFPEGVCRNGYVYFTVRVFFQCAD